MVKCLLHAKVAPLGTVTWLLLSKVAPLGRVTCCTAAACAMDNSFVAPLGMVTCLLPAKVGPLGPRRAPGLFPAAFRMAGW